MKLIFHQAKEVLLGVRQLEEKSPPSGERQRERAEYIQGGSRLGTGEESDSDGPEERQDLCVA